MINMPCGMTGSARCVILTQSDAHVVWTHVALRDTIMIIFIVPLEVEKRPQDCPR